MSDRPEGPHLYPAEDAIRRNYSVLVTLSSDYPELKGRLSMHYSPLRHSTRHPKATFAFDLHA